jgi:predicted nucleotidyltransferase component of viral defense system
MISKQVLMEQAKIHNLPANTIEKDYVLSWILAGIAEADKLKNHWVFKGGTCLKKCFFESYRFSEDLDYTITDPAHRNLDFLKSEFLDVSEWIYGDLSARLCDKALLIL